MFSPITICLEEKILQVDFTSSASGSQSDLINRLDELLLRIYILYTVYKNVCEASQSRRYDTNVDNYKHGTEWTILVF